MGGAADPRIAAGADSPDSMMLVCAGALERSERMPSSDSGSVPGAALRGAPDRVRSVLSVPTPDVTALLTAWADGDASALEQIGPLVHRELHRIARHCMAAERTGHTLQPTALLNEAYLRFAGVARLDWQNRAHFFAMSARLMRRILVDVARTKHYQKRGGGTVAAVSTLSRLTNATRV